jgi:hypothetical protein
MLLNPCIDCERRTATCHAKCEQYREFQRTREAIREKRIKENSFSDYFFQAKRKHKKR